MALNLQTCSFSASVSSVETKIFLILVLFLSHYMERKILYQKLNTCILIWSDFLLQAVELFLKLVEKTQISSVLFRCM
jgi:hypothetical protein